MAVILQNGHDPAKYDNDLLMTLRSTTMTFPRKFGKFARANGNGQTLRSAGLNRHAASGVTEAEALHDL